MVGSAQEFQEWAGLSTATVSDALDKISAPGSARGIGPLTSSPYLIGRAFTVRYVPAGSPPGTVGDYLDEVPPGGVVVLDNDGRTDCTVWGDILTAVAVHRELAGTVVNGVCRDSSRALSLGYPLFSRGRFMRTGKDRVEVAEIGGSVSVGDTRARAGDLIIGDDDGVVVVAHEHEVRVLELARQIAAREQEILSDALAQGSLRQARSRHGYHSLQRGEGGHS